MDYRDGPHIITAKKPHVCEKCKIDIQPREVYFARVEVIEVDKKKDYKRYHLSCALELDDLKQEECNMIVEKMKFCNEQEALSTAIDKVLAKYEYQGELVSLPYNNQNNKHYIIQFRGGPSVIVSLQSNNKVKIARWLEQKFEFIKKMTGWYHIVDSMEEFHEIMNRYIINN